MSECFNVILYMQSDSIHTKYIYIKMKYNLRLLFFSKIAYNLQGTANDMPLQRTNHIHCRYILLVCLIKKNYINKSSIYKVVP